MKNTIYTYKPIAANHDCKSKTKLTDISTLTDENIYENEKLQFEYNRENASALTEKISLTKKF